MQYPLFLSQLAPKWSLLFCQPKKKVPPWKKNFFILPHTTGDQDKAHVYTKHTQRWHT